MGTPSLLLDLPVDLAVMIWAPIVSADPWAVLRMETTSKAFQNRLQIIGFFARAMILNKRQLANFRVGTTALLEAERRLADTGSTSRPDYLALSRAVGSCQVAARRLSRIRLKLYERQRGCGAAELLDAMRELDDGMQQDVWAGFRSLKQRLQDLRAQVAA